MIDIYLPLINQGLFRHTDDSFREIVLEWGRRGYVNVIRSDEPYIWWGKKDDILLYDRDTFMWYDKTTPKYNMMLCGCENRNLINSSTWIYWARHPLNLENLDIIPFHKRQFTSIFIGRIENEVQAQYRHTDWKKYIELFDILVAREGLAYKYTNTEYLDLLRYSKFGLCLRGFGPKCHREVELMACGTVPIITQEVDIDNYYNPPIEGIHYIRVSRPEDIPTKINAITREKWEQMSNACIQWYHENCSVEGSFIITKKIIDNITKIPQKIESISTLTNKNCIFDLTLLLNTLSRKHKDIPVFIACDTEVKQHFEKNHFGLTLHFETCLDKYNGMNRQQMEEKGLFLDFTLEKETILRKAMTQYSNSLFLDADICLLDELPNVDLSKDIILSRHYIIEENENKYGQFNVGYFFVNNIKFLDWFRTTSKTRSHFFEQQTLDYCYEEFKVGYFPIQNNFGWWRLFECDKPRERLDKFNVQNGQIYYDGQPLRSIHTHFRETTESYTTEFNKFIITILEKSQNQKDILDFIQKDQNTPNTQSSLKISLIVQTYPEKNADRLDELILCIISNLQNKNVSRVINLCEGDSDSYLPDIIRDHSKYTCKTGYERLTYKTGFDYSNEHLNGEIVGLMNTDIMLADDFKISDLEKVLKNKVVIANSRHEIDLSNGNVFLDENFKRMYHANTQDAWFYKTPIQADNVDFELGLLGCDNAISHRLQVAGYTVFNMPERFKIIHVDSLRGKNSDNFSTFHKKYEVKNKIVNKHPENIGQLLVPNYDAVREMSFDKFLQILGYTEEEKVWLMTRTISEKIKITN
jgi:hypothetical protein